MILAANLGPDSENRLKSDQEFDYQQRPQNRITHL
jgi:hypothetical protein